MISWCGMIVKLILILCFLGQAVYGSNQQEVTNRPLTPTQKVILGIGGIACFGAVVVVAGPPAFSAAIVASVKGAAAAAPAKIAIASTYAFAAKIAYWCGYEMKQYFDPGDERQLIQLRKQTISNRSFEELMVDSFSKANIHAQS